MYGARLYQHLRAPNDASGNPRRCYVIFDVDANILDVVDEGYSGFPAVYRDMKLAQLPTMTVTPSEYRQFLKIRKVL